MIARADDWKKTPFDAVIQFDYTAQFNASQHERLRQGFVPMAMEDKWFIYHENDVLYFHRSWTGQPIYRAHLERAKDGYVVKSAWRAADYGVEAGVFQHRSDLDFLIRRLLLDEPATPMVPSGVSDEAAPLYLHALFGSSSRKGRGFGRHGLTSKIQSWLRPARIWSTKFIRATRQNQTD